jgi:hypothetical protein
VSESDRIWALLVAGRHAESGFAPLYSTHFEIETQQLLRRARAVAAPARTCALVAEEFGDDWRALAAAIPVGNLFTQPCGESTQSAVTRCLREIGQRDPQANLILIPGDHCAKIENDWIEHARNALDLGARQADTVFVLHDKPENDPRTSRHYPGVCSSSVLVGSLHSLLELCVGVRLPLIVDLDVVGSGAAAALAAPAQQTLPAPLKVVHISSVEEYARLQRGEYGRAPSQIDLRA